LRVTGRRVTAREAVDDLAQLAGERLARVLEGGLQT
jgi:hypothetical protein